MEEASSPVLVLPVSAAITTPLSEINCLENSQFDLAEGESASVGDVEEVGEDVEVRTAPGSDDDDSASIGAVESLAGDELLVSNEEVVNLGAENGEIVDVRVSELDVKTVVQSPIRESEIGAGASGVVSSYVPLWGTISICGRRPEMEDAVAAEPWFFEIPGWMLSVDGIGEGGNQGLNDKVPAHFFGVFDGHGGAQVANYCRVRMHIALVEEINNVNRNLSETSNVDCHKLWETAFSKCFVKVDDEVGGKVRRGATASSGNASEAGSSNVPTEPIAPETVGSTAVVAVVCSTHIIVSNCGDSRAVLCRGKLPVAVPLSVDHKPNREDEYARIEAAGGKVIQWNGYRVFGVLAMSRSIGDGYLKPWIIPDPEVTIVTRSREDECLILASDGLWDVLSNEEVCEVARKRILIWHKKNGTTPSAPHRGEAADPAALAAADYLSKLALQRGSKDNITVIVLDLKAHRRFRSRT